MASNPRMTAASVLYSFGCCLYKASTASTAVNKMVVMVDQKDVLAITHRIGLVTGSAGNRGFCWTHLMSLFSVISLHNKLVPCAWKSSSVSQNGSNQRKFGKSGWGFGAQRSSSSALVGLQSQGL